MALFTVRQKILLKRILSVHHPEWALLVDNPEALESSGLSHLSGYLERVVQALELFIPARRPDFGITERGGDAIVAYFAGKAAEKPRRFYLMLDISGFTALLTFLTDRFGKQEAGDIMNMSILNRYCLNRIGLLVHHFGNPDDDCCSPAEKALKTALTFRALLVRVTGEVRQELALKLSGKPQQEIISPFIRKLEIKASGSVVAPEIDGSQFYGGTHRFRITWGSMSRQIAAAEKVGGSDERVDPRLAESKGLGLDRWSVKALQSLTAKGWLTPGDFRLRKQGEYHKLVLTPHGRDKLLEQAEDILKNFRDNKNQKAQLRRKKEQRDRAGEFISIRQTATRLEELLPFLCGMDFIELAVRYLDPQGDSSILFADISSRIHETGILFTNFTLSGPEVLDDLSEVVHEVTSRYGLVCKYNIFPLGDFNLMAVLGLGTPGAQAANRFYAEILWHFWRDLLAAVGQNFGARVALRSGMSVGKCLQGPAGDNLIHNELTVIGPDCNLAARLLARAMVKKDGANGTMVVTDDCCRPVRHLILPVESFEKAHLKGFSEPVPLFSLTPREANENLKAFAARLRQLPLVTMKGGIIERQIDLKGDPYLVPAVSFLEGMERTRGNRRGVLAFVGPGGMGKTRRMAELMVWGLERGWAVLFGECLSWYQGSTKIGALEKGGGAEGVPFHPFIRILGEQVFDILPQDDVQAAIKKIQYFISGLPGGREHADQAGIIASYLGMAVPEGKIPEGLDPGARRDIFFTRVAEIFERIIAKSQKGLLLCLDDIYWADPGSLKLLRYLIHKIAGNLVICTSALDDRDLESLSLPEQGTNRERVHFFALKPLARRGTGVLARLALGLKTNSRLPTILEKKIGELENNPLFIIEFCRKLQETGTIFVRDGMVMRVDDEGLNRLSIPNRVQAVIEGLIDSLPPQDFDFIRQASVLGNTLHSRHVAELNSLIASERKTDPKEVQKILHSLAGNRILEIVQDRGPDSVYRFSRALIAHSLYQGLPPTLRKRLHLAAAEIYRKSGKYNLMEKNLNCALHFELAERPHEAAVFYLESARGAGEIFENERAVKLLDKVERFCDRHRLEGGERLRLETYSLRGDMALIQGLYHKALEDSKRAERLAMKLKDISHAGRALLISGRAYLTRAQKQDFNLALAGFRKAEKRLSGERLLSLEALNGQARVLIEMGRLREAREKAEEAVSSLDQMLLEKKPVTKGWLLQARLLRTLGSALLRQGRNEEALQAFDRGLALVDRKRDSSVFPIRARLLNSKALALTSSFRLAEAIQFYYQARSTARRVGDVNLEIVIVNNLSVAFNDSGRSTRAIDLLMGRYESLRKLAVENRSLASYEFNIGESYHFLEDYTGAELHYRRALEIACKIGSRQFAVNVMYNLGESLRDQGQKNEARSVLFKGLDTARRNGYLPQEMDLENILGEMELEEGKIRQAIRRHRRALSIAGELGTDIFGRSWSLRNLAVDLVELGDPEVTEEARKMIFSSLELSRKAGQPENIMETLRRIIQCAGSLRITGGEREKLIGELRELAEEQKSGKYLDFLNGLSGGAIKAGEKRR